MQVHCISVTVSEHVWVVGREVGGARGGGVGGCYQPGLYVPLKALFLVFFIPKNCGSDSWIKKKISIITKTCLYTLVFIPTNL